MTNIPVYKKILFTIFFLIILFIVIEVIGSFVNYKFSYQVATFSVPMLSDRQYVQKDEKLFWKFKPSIRISSRWSWPSKIRINRTGFRNPNEYVEQKEKNVIRIACIGNSITFGYRRSLKESFTYILENNLNKLKNKKYEVYNFGVPGYTSHQGLIVLKNIVLQYKPDIVTILYGINDARDVTVADKNQKIRVNVFTKLEYYLQKLFSYKIFMRLYYLSMERKFGKQQQVKRVSPEDYQKNIKNMLTICGQNNIKPILITPPYNPVLKNKLYGNDLEKYIEQIRKITNNQTVESVDFVKVVFEKYTNENINIIWDSCHPDYKGNIILAKLIEDKVKALIK